jgi:hypothetical protein
MVGALLGLVGNLLHPGTPNDPQGIAHVIAGSGMWVSMHTTIMVLFVLMLAGLVAIAHSIGGGGAGVLSRFGVVAAVAGITAGLGLIALDGSPPSNSPTRGPQRRSQRKAAFVDLVQAQRAITFALLGLFNFFLFAGVTFVCTGWRWPAVSGSRAGDTKQWQHSGGVAGVAAQRGGDVAVAVETQDADGQGLRRLAMALGAVPVRTWEASSAKVVSRRWCSASMPQCPWIQSARRAGEAWAAVRLVMADTATVRQRRWCRGRTRRVRRIAWVAWGKSRPATVVTCRRRVSARPWPRSRVWSATGMSRHGRRRSCWCRVGWLALTISR